MQARKSFVAEIKARGQLTIPKKIRDVSSFEEGQVVSLIPVGESIIISPRRLVLDEARRQIAKIMKESVVTLDELLASLEEERKILFREHYGRESR